jgi:type IV pilus assembly protein PilB
MPERRTIGQILMGLGRISEEDVARALEHQRDHGGYFGEALVACGAVSPEELEWGLASQFDLPYVFPEADSIDPEAAALVSPDWALANLTLPIMKTDTLLTVIVESPLATSAVDELSERTELEIQLALASGSKIRELIRQVYARGVAAEPEGQPSPIELAGALDMALEAMSRRFGISTRGSRSWAWWDDTGTVRRRPLDGDWRAVLGRALTPEPNEVIKGEPRAEWNATIKRAGLVTTVSVIYLSDESGQEFVFRPRYDQTPLRDRFPPPSGGVLSEIRLLARSGSARFVVLVDPPELGHEIVPHLPALLLDPSWRSVYINTDEQAAAGEVFSFRMPTDAEQWSVELETLRAFHFDVVTADLSGNQESWTSSALDVASVAFLLWAEGEVTQPAYEAGVRWILRIVRDIDGQLEWSVEPLRG